jgi:preprotein translocase subunit SecG
MLLGLLLSLNILVCLALIAVVLLQRSEGGALGSGSPTGLITTRGAGDLLTRTTWILFGLFLAISLALTLIGGRERSSQAIIDRLKLQSVDPNSLRAPTAPPPPGATPAPPADQAPPPAVQLPPLATGRGPAPVARRAPPTQIPHSAAAQTIHAVTPGSANSPPTLSLPPLATPPPAATPAPKP